MSNIPTHQFRTDAHLLWRVVVNSGQTLLSECNIKLLITGPHSLSIEVPFHFTQGGKAIEFDFPGTQQRYQGTYGLKMWFNYNKQGMGCINIPNAFELDDTTNSAILYHEQQHTLEYDSALSIGIQGPQGRPGYTPRKSIDYFTQEDIDTIVSLTHDTLYEELKAELHDEILAELLEAPTLRENIISILKEHGLIPDTPEEEETPNEETPEEEEIPNEETSEEEEIPNEETSDEEETV